MTGVTSSVRLLFLVLICAIAMPPDATAQTTPNPTRSGRPRTTLWTVVGAAAGFGAGLWAGLTVFDDAVNSDRKVWTTAVLSAAGGGVAGYLIGRHGSRPTLAPSKRSRTQGRSRLELIGESGLAMREAGLTIREPGAIRDSGLTIQIRDWGFRIRDSGISD